MAKFTDEQFGEYFRPDDEKPGAYTLKPGTAIAHNWQLQGGDKLLVDSCVIDVFAGKIGRVKTTRQLIYVLYMLLTPFRYRFWRDGEYIYVERRHTNVSINSN